MHLEVRTEKPGACPKCAMALVPAAPAVPRDFDLVVEATPRAIRPGKPVRLRFAVKNPMTGEQVRNFGLLHDKLFHLFVVSQDLSEFQHIHPTYQPDGSFVIDTLLPRPGHYKIYSDFYPEGGVPQVLQQDLTTAGHTSDLYSSRPRLEADASLTKMVDGMKVALTLDPVEPIAGRSLTLKYHLTDAATGASIVDLTPYLAAWGHTLILSEDQTDYVHSHPVELVPEIREGEVPRGGPDVTFESLLPKPGFYRIWTQFLRAGRDESAVTTVSFTIRARRLGER
jgi:heavy metal-binding protein